MVVLGRREHKKIFGLWFVTLALTKGRLLVCYLQVHHMVMKVYIGPKIFCAGLTPHVWIAGERKVGEIEKVQNCRRQGKD